MTKCRHPEPIPAICVVGEGSKTSMRLRRHYVQSDYSYRSKSVVLQQLSGRVCKLTRRPAENPSCNDINERLTNKAAFTLAEGATHINRQHNYRKSAFTLAEVLITLGIIGVVAALVMPTLTNKVQDKVLETQRKKAMNVVSTGIQKMMVDYEIEDSYYLPIAIDLRKREYNSTVEELKKVYNIVEIISADSLHSGTSEAYTKYNIPEIYKDSNGAIHSAPFDSGYIPVPIFITADGFMYEFLDAARASWRDPYSLKAICDVNGGKNPNVIGKDLIVLRVDYNGKVSDITDSSFSSSYTCTASNLRACTTPAACSYAGGYFAYGTYCVEPETDN